MTYYPLSVLMLAGIREILVISTPRDLPVFQDLLGDGLEFGLDLSYTVQPHPNGLAEAFIIGRDFIGNDSVSMILGDNIYFGEGLSQLCRTAASRKSCASVFAYHVEDPQRYGVVSFDKVSGTPLKIEEKPACPEEIAFEQGWLTADKVLQRPLAWEKMNMPPICASASSS
ncbi:glucose-1-phosphate thymidylyltransferase short form [Mesorhizobium robiniae]|uniref:glucose-1-phosphate thymidylyltransferase n=1 Tax=Mesorhizobium robiniae TaxID=559315 RepID=A0ABV2GQ52_9HYPH